MKATLFLIIPIFFLSCEDKADILVNSFTKVKENPYMVVSIEKYYVNPNGNVSRYHLRSSHEEMFHIRNISFIEESGKYKVGDTLEFEFKIYENKTTKKSKK